MRNNQYPHIAANERLRVRLDDIYACLHDCLNRLYVQDAFEEVADALCKEMDELLLLLGQLEEQYHEELPLESEEPRGVEWMKENEHLASIKQSFLTHSFAQNKPSVTSLVKRLDITMQVMERIDAQLYPEDDPDIYASYSKRELKDYLLNRWNKYSRELRNQLACAPSTHQKEYFEEQLELVFAELKSIKGYFISADASVIYYEGLGRFLWQLRHMKESEFAMDDILRLIKTAEYYCGRLQCKFIYLDRETSPEEEQNEQVRLERLKQETLQHQVEQAFTRLSWCKGYLAKDFSEGFFGKMLHDMVNSEHCAKVCDKMSQRKIRKFVHQIAGTLKEQRVFEECSYGDLADDMKYNKPRRDSRIDYIRHMIEDVPEIQEWLVAYIAAYREELKRKKEAEQQGVNVNC